LDLLVTHVAVTPRDTPTLQMVQDGGFLDLETNGQFQEGGTGSVAGDQLVDLDWCQSVLDLRRSKWLTFPGFGCSWPLLGSGSDQASQLLLVFAKPRQEEHHLV
jgi:hypothetical protein